jgi:Ca2+-binding EF-hand superfamily protein
LDEAVEILKTELKFPEARAQQFVKRFDKNNDGKLSAEEFFHFKQRIEDTKKTLMPRFKEYDVDQNGYISLEEANKMLQNPPFHFPHDKVLFLLKHFDRDGNGKLDLEEFAGFFAEAQSVRESLADEFDRLDKDGNGVLTPDEVTGIIQNLLGFDAEAAKSLVHMFDQNRDGSLDKREFVHMWESMFAQLQ